MTTYELSRAAKVQAEYCASHHLPNFVGDGECEACHRNVFSYYEEEKAGRMLVTGCPFCHHSFVE